MKRDYTSIRLEITSSCNMNCLCCHNKDYINKGNDMTTDEILQLVKSLKKSYNINKVLLTGGEPMMKNDLCYIIASIANMGIKVDMVTNGTCLTLELLKKMENAGLKRIRLSIDELGNKSEVRDKTIPSDLWEKAKMVVENSKVELCIHTVASTYNVKELFNIYKKVLEVKAARWRVFDIGYQGGVVNEKIKFNLESYYNDLINSTQEIVKDYLKNGYMDVLDIEINNIFKTSFLSMKKEDFENFDFYEQLAERLKHSPCAYVAEHQLSVRSDGRATLCQYFHSTIYDFKKSVLDISKVVETYAIENELTMKDITDCSKCMYCLVCNSGCRSRAQYLTGNIYNADPVGCYLHKKVHEDVMSLLPSYVQEIYKMYINPEGLAPKYSSEDLKSFIMLKGYNT